MQMQTASARNPVDNLNCEEKSIYVHQMNE